MDSKTRELLIAGIFVIIGAVISAVISPLLTSYLQDLVNQPPVMVDLSSDLLSPQPHDKSITWFAIARDPNNDPLDYKFQLKGPSTGNMWKDQQYWSQRNSWIWDTSALDFIGNYTIRVIVRDNRHVQSEIGDSEKDADYTLTRNSVEWLLEGFTLDKEGNIPGAIQAYRESSKLAPKNAEVWNWLGNDLYYSGKYDEALQAHNKAIELDPKNAVLWRNKANDLLNLDRYSEYSQALDRADELESKN